MYWKSRKPNDFDVRSIADYVYGLGGLLLLAFPIMAIASITLGRTDYMAMTLLLGLVLYLIMIIICLDDDLPLSDSEDDEHANP